MDIKNLIGEATEYDKKEMLEYPERAVLESCVNALIHRDYQIYANVSNGAKPIFRSELSEYFGINRQMKLSLFI